MHETRRWFSLLLVTCLLWQGPLFVVDCHNMLSSSSPAMARHLDAFHWMCPTLSDDECHACHWHFHFLLPPSNSEIPLSASQARGQANSLTASLTSSEFESLYDDSLFRTLLCGSRLFDILFRTQSLHHSMPGFFSSFAEALPLPLRFSVMRC